MRDLSSWMQRLVRSLGIWRCPVGRRHIAGLALPTTAMAISIATAPLAGQTTIVKVEPVDAAALAALDWSRVAEEVEPDGRFARLPDARSLSWALDPESDRLWFRIDLAGPVPADWFGVNVAVDTDLDPDNGASWWGSNAGFRFDRLLTAYLSRGTTYWQGAFGLSDAEAVARFDLSALDAELAIGIDREHDALLLGLPWRQLDSDGRFRLIATVGSNALDNDDIPNLGSVLVELPVASGSAKTPGG